MITIKPEHEIVNHFPEGKYNKDGVVVDLGYYVIEYPEGTGLEIGSYTSFKDVVWC